MLFIIEFDTEVLAGCRVFGSIGRNSKGSSFLSFFFEA